MKIAFVTDFFYPELSGVADAVLLLGSTLTERGHEVAYFVPKYPNTIERPQNHVVRLPSVHFPFSPTKQGRIPLPIGIGIMALRRFKPDIIHTHSPYTTGIEALAYARLSHTPLVGTHHTITSEFMGGSPRWIVDATLRYNSWYYNHCSFVSAPSQSLIDEMLRYGLTSTHRSISNPVDVSHFKKISRQSNEPVILYAGRLSPDKHVDVILRALPEVRKIIPASRIVIAGRGSAEPHLRRLAAELSISDAVDFRGFVPMEKMPAFYNECSVFAIMSTSDSQSLVLMQAMASGKPVVGARAWALGEYITPDVGVTVEPGDYMGLAEILIDLLGDPRKGERLGAGGMIKVSHYAPQAIAEIWEKIYTDECNNHKN